MIFSVVPINKNIDRKTFDCGIDELNRYLVQFALPNDKKNIGKTFVAVDQNNPHRPLGYYTVSMAQILVSDLPDEIRSGLPRYPIPAMRLGKLAIDKAWQGKGFGADLLKDVLLRTVSLSSEVALRFLLVDALDESAKAFYVRYGFIPFTAHPLTLVLPIETIKDAIDEA